jgi:hypothetical protein
MQTGSSETLIGWKSGKTTYTYVPQWERMERALLWTLEQAKTFQKSSSHPDQVNTFKK